MYLSVFTKLMNSTGTQGVISTVEAQYKVFTVHRLRGSYFKIYFTPHVRLFLICMEYLNTYNKIRITTQLFNLIFSTRFKARKKKKIKTLRSVLDVNT